jgi:hypothetical protein
MTRPRVAAGTRQDLHGSASTRRHLPAIAVTALLTLIALAVPSAAAAGTPGVHVWSDTVFNVGGSGDETAVAVATDAAGYPIIVGNAVTSANGDFDIRYRSYDLNGILRWNAVGTTWSNPLNPASDDTAAGLVVDNAHNCVYVAGTTQGPTTGKDIVLLKVLDIDSGGPFSGDLIWAQTYASPRNDEAEAVALDKYGNVYVTGGTRRADGSMDVLTVKYRPDGTRVWAKRHNNSLARFDRGRAIAVRGSAVYVAGVSNRKGHRDDLVLIRYTLGGKRTWVRYYDDPLHRHESLSGMATTGGAVYLCGSGKFTNTRPGDALLVKYRADGRRLWARYVSGSRSGDDAWNDVAVDSKGRAHVTGFLHRSTTGDDIVTRVFTTSGRLSWQAGYSSTGSHVDAGRALAVDSAGRTYVCGLRAGTLGDVDGVVIKYSARGATLWDTAYPDASVDPSEIDYGDDWFEDVVVAGSFVYAAGRQTIDHAGVVDADFLTVSIGR